MQAGSLPPVRIADRVLEGITCIRLGAAQELLREPDWLASRRGYQVTYSVGWALGTRDALGKVRESAREAAIDGRGEVGERCRLPGRNVRTPWQGFRANGGARPAAAKRSEERNEISYECRQHWLRFFPSTFPATPAD